MSWSSLSRVRLVHQRDFARNGGPLQIATKRFVASLTLVLFPLQKFVSESKVWLNYNIKSSCPNKAAGMRLVLVKWKTAHYLLGTREG